MAARQVMAGLWKRAAKGHPASSRPLRTARAGGFIMTAVPPNPSLP